MIVAEHMHHLTSSIVLKRGCLLLDSLRDFDSHLERRRRLRARHARLATSGCAFDKGKELALERFFAFDRNSVPRNATVNQSIHITALILIIEREICVLLKNADLAHPLRTDPT
jgi:hypothetical protein